jgi:hypothetical protein
VTVTVIRRVAVILMQDMMMLALKKMVERVSAVEQVVTMTV